MDIEARRAELERALFEAGYSIGTPTAEAQARRNDAMQRIQRELATLPPKPSPPTGMRAGSIIVGADRLLAPIEVGPLALDETESAGHHSTRYGEDDFPWREFAPDP